MRVLVACEYSGTVRDAFIRAGHDAVSCDLLPSSSDFGPHMQTCALEATRQRWDLIIAHPPCTALAASGAQYWPDKRADGSQQKAIDFFMKLMDAPCPRVAVENPVGIMGTVYRKADQIVQPWMFGDAFNKKTCLWLRGLPRLQPTNVVVPTHNWGSNSYRGGGRKLSPLPSLHWMGHERSKSFTGIADAMAQQWGGLR
jgi:hypothetical protein